MLAAGAGSHIRVQNGVFVDDNCKEFMFSGYNAWQVQHQGCVSLDVHLAGSRELARRSRFGMVPQVLEQAAQMCCGNRDALVSQFREAGVRPMRRASCQHTLLRLIQCKQKTLHSIGQDRASLDQGCW